MSFQRRLAHFNRVFGNRIVGRIIPLFPGFAAVHHYGRKSGREYRTPVKIFRWGDTYVISLAYGSSSDWVQNVLAASGCDLVIRGRRVHLVEPNIFTDGEQVEIPAFIRRMLKRVKATEFLALRPAETTSPRA